VISSQDQNEVQSDFAIFTTGLTKSFGSHNAVDSIDLRVPKGSIFGFLGPNGSGKTTTIRMLMALANISAGEIRMLGYSIPDEIGEALPKVGALVEGPAFYPYMSGRDNLIRFDAADRFADPKTRSERVDKALARVGLTQAASKKVHAYSLGMKQRLGIANALLQPRELLVLDEPTNGLDPQGTREVRNLIRSLAAEGITIFISSHLLVEIENICSHLAVMSRGKIVAQGSIEELSASPTLNLHVTTKDGQRAVEALKTLGITATIEGTHVRSVISADLIAPEHIVRQLVELGIGVQSFTLLAPTLEERFVGLTGEGFDVAR
jgi:ABC-2 type transport system ATP-binding protein